MNIKASCTYRVKVPCSSRTPEGTTIMWSSKAVMEAWEHYIQLQL